VTETTSKPPGRPSSFTEESARAICERIMAGDSLRSICAEEGMPERRTVFRWLAANETFRHQYARAKAVQADVMAEEITEIADDGTNDWMDQQGENAPTGWKLNGEHVQRSRVRIDARKWLMGKLAPKKYGESSSLELSGPDKGPIVVSASPLDERL